MKKLTIALLALTLIAGAAVADKIATTDFYNNGLVGGDQEMDMTANDGSTLATGVASAYWRTGSGLTDSGTASSHSIWANGWQDNEATDYFELEFTMDNDYKATLNTLQQMTRASGSGPDAASIDIEVNGVDVFCHTYATSTGYNNQQIDLGGISVSEGSTVNIRWTGTGATHYAGSWRIGNYFDNGYQDTGVFGSTELVPEPATLSLVALGGIAAAMRRRRRK